MATESEIKLARYNTVEKEADAFNRIIGVRRLKPSEQAKIGGMTSDLTGYDEAIGEDGQTIKIPHRFPLMVAASVCWIDDSPIPFPRDRAHLDAIYDRLDSEGITAAAKAMSRLTRDEPEDQLDAAKN